MGLTRAALAELMGLARLYRSEVSKWEQNDCVPSKRHRDAIIDVFSVDPWGSSSSDADILLACAAFNTRLLHKGANSGQL